MTGRDREGLNERDNFLLDNYDEGTIKEILAEELKLRGREHCAEYDPAWPVSRYNGACKFYLKLRRHCGVPFVNSQVCKSGAIDNFNL